MSDYADRIADDIMVDAQDDLPSILSGPDLRAALAEAARQGYAHGTESLERAARVSYELGFAVGVDQ